jgi:putative Ca2+/H+ antiporter (TMEM165/GDT1 family)
MFAAFFAALLLVAVAEFGDKTQMLTLVLSARYGVRRVLIGVAAAIVALQLLAVLAGGLVGALIPPGIMAWVSGLAFIGFGVWTLAAPDDDEDIKAEADRSSGHGPIVGTALAFFVAELGDKTQIMTVTIAANPAASAAALGTLGMGLAGSVGAPDVGMLVAVWLGSVVGMLLVNGLAAVVGMALGTRLSPSIVRRVSGVVFLGFGLITIASRVLGG